MKEEKYHRPRPCRLCQGPILGTGVLMQRRRRMDRLRRWWKAHFGTEYTKPTCPVCYFCVWDLRYADENSVEKEPLDQKWWPPHKLIMKSNNAINYYKYYNEELMKPCSVKITLTMATKRVLEEMRQRGVGQRSQCIYCPKVFDSFSLLSNHVQKRHRDQDIRCRVLLCRRFFLTQDEKLQHLEKEHQTMLSFKCFYCEKVSFNKNSLNSHLYVKHKDQLMKCKYVHCDLLFKTEAERDQHFDEKHNFGKYFCCFCDRYFAESSQQWQHMKKNHKEALKCNAIQTCPNYFESEKDRQKHVQEKHPKALKKFVNCTFCPTLLEEKLLGRHVKSKDVAIICEFQRCVTIFKTEEERQKHKEEFHERNKFFCIYCDKTVCMTGPFASHLRKHHSEEEIIRCDALQCVTYFKSQEEKLAHTKERHQSLDNNIICIYCNEFVPINKAKGTANITHHMQRFHSEIVIKCTYHCNTYFKTLEEREKHIKEVHQAEKIKEPFPCLYCDKISADLISFRKHVTLRHLDVAIKCPFRRCGQHFKRQEELENHLKQNPRHKIIKKGASDNPKKTFACPLCPKVYNKKSTLTNHTKCKHERKREMKCPHCKKAISAKSHIISVFCQICKKKFLCPGLLRIHNLTCKPNHQCPVCAKIFIAPSHLLIHCTQLHTAHIQQWKGLEYKSLGFKCDKCFIYFRTKGKLNRHLKNESHFVLKLTCNFCKKELAHRDSLQRHIVKKHLL